MANLEAKIQEILPEVTNYITTAISILCYILFFINKYSIKHSGKTIQTLVKEKVTYVDKENVGTKKYVDKKVKDLTEENVRLNKEIASLTKRLKKIEKTITIMIEEEEEQNEECID